MTTLGEKVTKLSHKLYRALLKKLRRKKKRQLLAQARDEKEKLEQLKLESIPNYKEWEAEKQRNLELWEQFQERERIRKHKEWLLREEQAQQEFQRKKLLQEQEKERREIERKKMLAELEAKALTESTIQNEIAKAKHKKEEALQEALSGLPQGNEPWHNPIAPENYDNRPEREKCLFFNKTGCCRFGNSCSRGHAYPEVSTTLLIKGMYSHFSIGQSSRDDYDTDMALEYEDKETYQDFKKFYDDVLPEFKMCGKVVQFKVCCNHEPHLRGNVYVQFSKENEAVEAYKKFNGRFYAGKQITLEFTNVVKWKAALCGLYESKRCPKGNNCNFLHVFRNPNNEFRAADRDLQNQENNGRFYRSSRSNGDRSSHRSNYSQRSYRDDYYHRNDDSVSGWYSRHSSSSSRKRHHSSDSDNSSDEYHSRHLSHLSVREDDRDYHRTSHRKKKQRSRSRSNSSESSTDNKKHKKKHKKVKKKKKRKARSQSRSD